MNPLGIDPQLYIVLSTILGNILGFFLKRSPKIKNALIPLVMLGITVAKNILIEAHFLPDGATAIDLSQFPDAGNLGHAVGFAVTTALDAALPIGIHSGLKNARKVRYTAQGVKEVE